MAQTLLVVDDEPAFGSIIAEIALRQGLNVSISSSGRNFQEVYQTLKPDVAVIDIVMPDFDGFELINWLAKAEHQCPIILVTGKNPAYIRQAKKLAQLAGLAVAGALEKPVDADALTDAISAALS